MFTIKEPRQANIKIVMKIAKIGYCGKFWQEKFLVNK